MARGIRSIGSRQVAGEWVGGRIEVPFRIEGEPDRPPIMTLWLEPETGMVVQFELSGAGEAPSAFGDSLVAAMRAPLIGPPRQPRTVRVCGAELADEVRRVLPGARVVDAPTPELQQVVDQMEESLPASDDDEDASYLEGGRIDPDTMHELFVAAKLLFEAAPWRVASDSQIIRVDIPAHGIEAGCISIIGAMEESLGFILFPSLRGYERFLGAADRPRRPGQPFDLGTTMLALDFEVGSALPASLRREVMKHGWPVAAANAYPVIHHRSRNAALMPISEREVRTITACALSLTTFFLKHGRLFGETNFEPICESYFNADDLEVRFTIPFEAADEFEVNTPSGTPREVSPGRQVKVGRNDPCPCGSGKKFKHCCLNGAGAAGRRDQGHDHAHESGHGHGESHARVAMSDSHTDPRASIHDLDRRLVERMVRFAHGRFGQRWIEPLRGLFRDPDTADEILGPWAFHHHGVDGKPISHWFREEKGAGIPAEELALLGAQHGAWLSTWEVLEVEPGTSILLRDLLTGEERKVQERTASRSLERRHAILARVIDHRGISVLGGLHPSALAPTDAEAVAGRVRTRLRRKGNVPVERLRVEAIGRYLITCWEEAQQAAVERALRRPELRNTDGDPFLITTDHFAFDPGDRAEIQRRLAAMPEVTDSPAADDPEQSYVLTRANDAARPGLERTVIGRVDLRGTKLRVETNSIRRADTVRSLLEGSLGSLARHRGREHVDANVAVAAHREASPPEREIASSPELDRMTRETKARSYADWADHPLPALAGKSARESVKTKAGRKEVDLLLREMELMESGTPAAQRFDFGVIRKQLGLE